MSIDTRPTLDRVSVNMLADTVRATGIAALHARNMRVKTPYCTQFTRALRALSINLHAGARKILHAIFQTACKILHAA